MLRQRLVTAALLGSLVIWSILALPTTGFALGLALVLLLCAWEWGRLLGLTQPIARVAYCGFILGLAFLSWPLRENTAFVWLVAVTATAYWCGVLAWLWRFCQAPRLQTWPVAGALAGSITLMAPWVALIHLHGTPDLGPYYVLFLMLLIWAADSGAYFAGTRWGHRKLAPLISPGKTWEGAYGALAVTLLLAVVGALAFQVEAAQRPVFVMLCVVTVGFSIVGDLFESMLKRQHHIKDSGSWLPGHGGILDRVDSMTAAAPIFLLGLRGLLLK